MNRRIALSGGVGGIGVALAVAVLVVHAAGGPSGAGPSGVVTFNGTAVPVGLGFDLASPAELAAEGITLRTAGGPVGGIDATKAEAVALAETARSYGPDYSIRRATMFDVQFTDRPSMDCTCWVVSLMPPGGIAHPLRWGGPQLPG